MYHIKRYRVELVREGTIKSEFNKVSSPTDAAKILYDYFERLDREHFIILLLDTKNKIIGIHTVSIGSLDSSIVHPREVYKPAILANAASVILAHNHPSGDPTPSSQDICVTDRLQKAGDILGISVLDHIIVGDSCHKSLKETGLM